MSARWPGVDARRWGARWLGAGLVAAYLLVASLTMVVSGHRVLPLFEGIGPPQPYRWVKPPAQFATGNVKPSVATTDVPVAAATSFSTLDGQLVASVSAASMPAHGTDPRVHVVITPLDPSTLGPLPAPLAPDGNAYRLQLTYEPSGTPVPPFGTPGDLVMTAPHAPVSLLFSADGRTWQRLSTQLIAGGTTAGAPFSRTGWFVAGYRPTSSLTTVGGGGGVSAVVGGAIGAAAGAVLLGVVALVWRRRNR